MVNLSGEESQSVRRLFDKGVVIPPQPRVLCELQDQIAKGVADVAFFGAGFLAAWASGVPEAAARARHRARASGRSWVMQLARQQNRTGV